MGKGGKKGPDKIKGKEQKRKISGRSLPFFVKTNERLRVMKLEKLS